MQRLIAGAMSGLAGAVVMSATMALGRRAGWLHPTLAEDSERWLDRTVGMTRRIGAAGTTAVEQGNHLTAGAGFGALLAALPPGLGGLPPALAGALYGAGLYAVNIAGVAPLLGITEGEQNAPPAQAAERLGLHLLFGVVTAVTLAALDRDQR